MKNKIKNWNKRIKEAELQIYVQEYGGGRGVLSKDNNKITNKRGENNILTLGLRSTKILFIHIILT